jgi:hypothetical protein
MKKTIVIGAIAVLFASLLLGLVPLSCADSPTPWIIEDNTVYIDDSNVYMSATPHTITTDSALSDLYPVDFVITPKTYTGDIDVVFGFDIPSVKPTNAEYYKPYTREWTTHHDVTFEKVFTYPLTDEPCYLGNDYNPNHRKVTYQRCNEWADNFVCTGYENVSSVICYDSLSQNGDGYTAYWHTDHSEVVEWRDVSGAFEFIPESVHHNYGGMNTWYSKENFAVVAGETYRLRIWMDISDGLVKGKYWFAAYPSNHNTPQEANNANVLYALDPWYDIGVDDTSFTISFAGSETSVDFDNNIISKSVTNAEPDGQSANASIPIIIIYNDGTVYIDTSCNLTATKPAWATLKVCNTSSVGDATEFDTTATPFATRIAPSSSEDMYMWTTTTNADGGLTSRTLQTNSDYAIIGVEWNQGTDTWRHIDINNNTLTLNGTDFDAHPVWGGMGRCTLADDGTVNNYGTNARGDGLILNGTDGRVMVEIPQFYWDSSSPSANVYRWWISPVARDGFDLYPAFVQRGGTERDNVYVGAFEASLVLKGGASHNDNTIQLSSVYRENATATPCTQPVTGGTTAIPTIFHVTFTSGSREFVVGEILTNNGLDAKVTDWYISGGTWGGGDAAGTLYGQVYNDPWAGSNWDAGIINDSGAVDIANASGAETNLGLTLDNSRTYTTTNIGSRWGSMNIWTQGAIQLLYYTEYAHADSQSTTNGIGKGVVSRAGGTGYNGLMCGADSTNTNVDTNGTGTGTETDGYTPVVFRGVENIWGNTWKYVDGYNAVDGDAPATDVKYRIVWENGTGTFADPLTTYEESTNQLNPSDGYGTNILFEDNFEGVFIASVTGGTASSYLYDYFYVHDAEEVNILFSGGSWGNGVDAGVVYRKSYDVASDSGHNFGARVEFV